MIRHHERWYTKLNQILHNLFKPEPVVIEIGKEYKLRSLVVSGTGRLKANTKVKVLAIVKDDVKISSLNGNVTGLCNKEQLINLEDVYQANPDFAIKENHRYNPS